MSAFSFSYLVCLTVLCLLSNDLPVKAWPQGPPQDAMNMAQTQMNTAMDTFAAQMPMKQDQDQEHDGANRNARSIILERLKRQTVDGNEFDDENSIIIPDLQYPEQKDLGQHLREGIERLAESIKQTWNKVAKSMEEFMGNIRQSFGGNQSANNGTAELTTVEYYNERM